MRVIALLSLLFGFMGLMLLDGQTFTHAVMGIVFGVAAIGCGLGAARKDFPNASRRWEGRILAGLGFVLAILCVAQLPSAYHFQNKFNEKSRRQLEIDEKRALVTQQSETNGKQPFDSQTNQTPAAAASRRSP